MYIHIYIYIDIRIYTYVWGCPKLGDAKILPIWQCLNREAKVFHEDVSGEKTSPAAR